MSEATGNKPPARTAGLEIPVFAIPRPGDLGCGDTQVVHQLIDLAADLGLKTLTLLPIQETVKANDPFAPLSLFALEPMLLDVSDTSVEDLSKADFDRIVNASKPSDEPTLDYRPVKKLKLDLLWHAFEHFWEAHYLKGTERARGFHRFCQRESTWLPDYSLFRMLMDFEEGRDDWESWSEDYRAYAEAKRFVSNIATRKPEAVERQLAFYAYVQWIADSQWRAVRAHADQKKIELITDLHCAVCRHCVEFFKAPDAFHSRKEAVYEKNLLGQIEARFRRLAPFFHQFRVSDFRKATAAFDDDETLQTFMDRLPSIKQDLATQRIKVAWEGLPSLAMQSTQLWPTPNGQLLPPTSGQLMSFSFFGTQSLRSLWAHDESFRRRLKIQWSVDASDYDQETTLSLLRKLFQYPSSHVQISFVDLAGLENDPSNSWLTRYEKGPLELMEAPGWSEFRIAFRKMLEQTSRVRSSREKALESV